LNESFTIISNHSIFEIENLVTNENMNGCILTHFDQIKEFKKMQLSNEAFRILTTPNAGGNSIQSEVLSFEFFKKYINAFLLKTEMEVQYFPEGGSINDFVMNAFDTIIGVSVTRAMKYPMNELFTEQDAYSLLIKKLRGINRSSKNSLIKWKKQILHVWVMNEHTSITLMNAWYQLEDEITTNTVLLITVAKNSFEIFMNSNKS
jgi:hypothetical protein